MQDRVACIEKWAAIADICRCMHNYNGVLQICAAFVNSSVYRLKKTWEKLSKQVKISAQFFLDVVLVGNLAHWLLYGSFYTNIVTVCNFQYEDWNNESQLSLLWWSTQPQCILPILIFSFRLHFCLLLFFFLSFFLHICSSINYYVLIWSEYFAILMLISLSSHCICSCSNTCIFALFIFYDPLSRILVSAVFILLSDFLFRVQLSALYSSTEEIQNFINLIFVVMDIFLNIFLSSWCWWHLYGYIPLVTYVA